MTLVSLGATSSRSLVMAKLFKDTPSDLFVSKGEDIKKRMEDFYDQSLSVNQAFWHAADIDTRFNAGDQTIFDEMYPDTPKHKRPKFSFNRIMRITNMISGFQRRNRKSTIVVPVSNGDQQTADQYSKILSHINRNQGVSETISEAFQGAVVTGLNLLHVWNDYRDDPVSGNIKVDALPYNSFLIDPYFKKSDLSDCNGLWKRSYLTKQEVISLLPKKKAEIELLSSADIDKPKFGYMPESQDWLSSNLFAYDEYYYKDYRKQKLLVDSETGEVLEWRNNDKERLEEFLATYPSVTVTKSEVPTIKLAIVVNGAVLYDGDNPTGIDKYPFVPVMGYFNPQLPDYDFRIQGVVRGLRDAQYLYNRRRNIELDILESQLNSGYIYKEDALVNPSDVFQTGQGKGLALKKTAQMSDVIPIQPGQIPPSMMQLSELLAKEVMEISGVNEELLGSASDDKAGVLAMMRQGAGLTTLQPLFDQLDGSQKILGGLMIDIIGANYSSGKVNRIIEEEPAPQFYDKAFGRYDAAVEEGFDTTTQKQTQFAQLLHLKTTGINIPDNVLIEAASLQNKTELIQAMQQQNEQAQQAEMQAQQTQNELIHAQTQLAKAKVESDLSLAKERDSRVFSNIGLMEERQHEAEKDKTQSMLNLVKTLQEIDNVDLDQLQKLLALSAMTKHSVDGDNKVETIGAAINAGATKDVDNVPTSSPAEEQRGPLV